MCREFMDDLAIAGKWEAVFDCLGIDIDSKVNFGINRVDSPAGLRGLHEMSLRLKREKRIQNTLEVILSILLLCCCVMIVGTLCNLLRLLIKCLQCFMDYIRDIRRSRRERANRWPQSRKKQANKSKWRIVRCLKCIASYINKLVNRLAPY